MSYSYKLIGGLGYVIHDETGVSLPYHSQLNTYLKSEVPSWKQEYFTEWLLYRSNSQRKKLKRDYHNMITTTSCNTVSLVCTPCIPQPSFPCWNEPCVKDYKKACKQEEENSMNTERDYLTRRLQNANSYAREAEIQKVFNLHTNARPTTYKELIDFIKNDKFKLNEKRTKYLDAAIDDGDFEPQYGDAFDGIIWTGKPQADHEGYAAANKENAKRYTAAKDIIMTGTPEAGLKALQDFEAWMPTAGTPAN